VNVAHENASDYTVDRVPQVDEQIRALVRKSAAAGEVEHVFAALDMMLLQLKTKPLEWGDPEFRTHKPGGLVFHGICPPLLARYAVYHWSGLSSYWRYEACLHHLSGNIRTFPFIP
jgi:hypothetical protein